MQLRPTVLLAVSNRQAFLQAFYDRGGSTGVWVPGKSLHDLGTHVDIEVAFAEEQIVLHTRGVVRSKRPSDRGNLRAGIGIDFLAAESRTRELILAFAKGNKELVRRHSRRLPVVVDVEVHLPRGRRTESTEDLSREGALLTFANPPAVGTMVQLTLRPDGGVTPVEVRAEVRWRRTAERPAVGVRFLFDEPEKAKELASLLETFRLRLAT
jgi:hypothetical protein